MVANKLKEAIRSKCSVIEAEEVLLDLQGPMSDSLGMYCYFVLFLGHVSLSTEQKQSIVIEHSPKPSVGLCVCLSSALWQNGRSDMDVVRNGRLDGS